MILRVIFGTSYQLILIDATIEHPRFDQPYIEPFQ